MTKKLLSLLLILTLTVLSVLSFASCSSSEDTADDTERPKPVDMGVTKTLNVYNWGEYISDGFEGSYDSNAEFEYYFNAYLAPKYGYNIKVNYTTYATNEDMYSKIHSLMSNGGDAMYDIVVPSDYMIQQMIESKMLLPFDAETIPNYSNISDNFKNRYYDPENLYSVPYTYGMVGIIYNPGLMDESDLNENGEVKNKSWDMLWNENYKGKILQFNNPRDAFGTAMYKLNLNINETEDLSVWEKAAEELKRQKPLVQGYVNDEIFNKMTTASAVLAPYFAGDFITMYDSLPEDDKFLKFYYPEEGTNVFIDAMCILKTSKMVDAAKEYINFMLDRDAAVANALYIGYASPNEIVVNDEEYLDEMGEDAIEILYGADPVEINRNYSHDPYYHKLDTATQENFYSLWESLKTENAIELWVHISSITIVVLLLAACTYSVIIKKWRSRFYRLRDKELRQKKPTQ